MKKFKSCVFCILCALLLSVPIQVYALDSAYYGTYCDSKDDTAFVWIGASDIILTKVQLDSDGSGDLISAANAYDKTMSNTLISAKYKSYTSNGTKYNVICNWSAANHVTIKPYLSTSSHVYYKS